jgi:hypothetical protein
MNMLNLKFGNMRKEQEFVIYPFKKEDKEIIIQSDKTIARIDINTGKMIYNSSPSGAYFVHLQMPSRKEMKMEEVTLQKIKGMIIAQGEVISLGGGCITADNSGVVKLMEEL